MARHGSLTVVGTGIRAIGQVTLEAHAHIQQAEKVLVLVADPLTEQWVREQNPTTESLHSHYAQGKDRLETYRDMSDCIMSYVREGLRVCAVFYGHAGVFAMPPHHAIRAARAEGYPAEMLAGVSADACLYADLGVDPGQGGCQSYEAMDLLVHHRVFDPNSQLVVWQIGVIGMFDHNPRFDPAPGLRLLTERLSERYPADHPVTVYEASTYVTCPSRMETVALARLPEVAVTGISTLYVPPAGVPTRDELVLAQLGMSPEMRDGRARLERAERDGRSGNGRSGNGHRGSGPPRPVDPPPRACEGTRVLAKKRILRQDPCSDVSATPARDCSGAGGVQIRRIGSARLDQQGGHGVRIVEHGDVATARQLLPPCVLRQLCASTRDEGQQYPVAAAEADRHRYPDGGSVPEPGPLHGREGLAEAGCGGHVVDRSVYGLVGNLERTSRRGGHEQRPGQPGLRRVGGQPANDAGVEPGLSHGGADVERGLVSPQAGRRQRGDGPCPLEPAEFEGDPAARAVSGDVDGLHAQFVEELRDGSCEIVRGVAVAFGLAAGFAVAGQVDRDDVAVGGQLGDDRVPRVAGQSLAVQEDQRLALSGAAVGEPGRAG